MDGRQCYHCKEWIKPGEAHDCWTTTEAALTKGLTEELKDAWERLRESAADIGEQRIYASGSAIMFARKVCYCFVRPKKQYLELCVFLGRTVKSPLVRKAEATSKTKVAHMIRITHRDEVEAPVTDWLREAYEISEGSSKPASKATAKAKPAKLAKKDDGKQLKRVRKICNSIPGILEKVSHGEPTFFTPKRVFAMFSNNHHNDGHIAVWLPAAPGAQEALIEEAPEIYYRPPYVGTSGWVGVELAKVDDEQLGALIRESYRLMTTKKPVRKA